MLAGNHNIYQKLISISLIAILFSGLGWHSIPDGRSEALAETKLKAYSEVRSSSVRFLSRYRKVILEAARRHNNLRGVSDEDFACWMEAILLCEMGGVDLLDKPIYRELGYPLWQGMKLAACYWGGNSSIGMAQIRPETAAQLAQGWIWHQERRIYHHVRPSFSLSGEGPYGISPQKLANPEVSIECLAANLEVAASVARAFGHEPNLEDLARWQNTGVGRWDLSFGNVEPKTWLKGSKYINKVEAQAWALSRYDLNVSIMGNLVYLMNQLYFEAWG